jgi:hypothetical protein
MSWYREFHFRVTYCQIAGDTKSTVNKEIISLPTPYDLYKDEWLDRITRPPLMPPRFLNAGRYWVVSGLLTFIIEVTSLILFPQYNLKEDLTNFLHNNRTG